MNWKDIKNLIKEELKSEKTGDNLVVIWPGKSDVTIRKDKKSDGEELKSL